MSRNTALFVVSTGKHLGKTSVCLGLLRGLRSLQHDVSYMKPIGTSSSSSSSSSSDADALLVRHTFDLPHDISDINPIRFGPALTKAYLDGNLDQIKKSHELLCHSFAKISGGQRFTVIEGSGHMGSGSVIGLSNAELARMFGAGVVLVAGGGVGVAVDDVALNVHLCRAQGIPVLGVILNRIAPEKSDLCRSYIQPALDSLNVPFLGCIPFLETLACPSLADLQRVLNAEVLSGEGVLEEARYPVRRLVSTTSDSYYELLEGLDPEGEREVLVITPAARMDVVFATIVKWGGGGGGGGGGMLLTGSRPPSAEVRRLLLRAGVPALYVARPTMDVVYEVAQFMPVLPGADEARLNLLIDLVAKNINFELLNGV